MDCFGIIQTITNQGHGVSNGNFVPLNKIEGYGNNN